MKGIMLAFAMGLGLTGTPLLADVDGAALAAKISRYWNAGPLAAQHPESSVAVRVTFARDGTPLDFQLIETNGPTKAVTDELFETTRRAVLRAHADGGLPLSADDYDSWQVLDLVFDANGMPTS